MKYQNRYPRMRERIAQIKKSAIVNSPFFISTYKQMWFNKLSSKNYASEQAENEIFTHEETSSFNSCLHFVQVAKHTLSRNFFWLTPTSFVEDRNFPNFSHINKLNLGEKLLITPHYA